MSKPKTHKTFRPYDQNQSLLLPPSLHHWLDEDDPARFLSDTVDGLDLSEFVASYSVELRGQPPYDPAMMVKILVWGYCVGIRSSRRIARQLRRDVAFRYLAANNFPDFRTISEFRRRHLTAFEGLFGKVLLLCSEAGLVKLGHVALDGTKMKANASKHKAMSYDYMEKEEARLKEEVQRMLAEAEKTDQEEDRQVDGDRKGDGLPEELQRREDRLQAIKEAKERLEARVRERDSETLEKDRKREEEGKPLPNRKHAPGVPMPKDQENFTDPESRIMKAGSDFIQGYNAQAAVDAEAQVIVAIDVTNQANDAGLASGMVEQIQDRLNDIPAVLTADAGYYSEDQVNKLIAMNVDPYIAAGRQKHSDQRAPAAVESLPDDATPKERMQQKLRTQKGKEIYARRKAIVEPVFGQIKEARGIRGFLMRGISKVKAEWSLICSAHNLLKLARHSLRMATK